MRKILLFLFAFSLAAFSLQAQENFSSPIVIGELVGNYDCGQPHFVDSRNNGDYADDIEYESGDVFYQFTVSAEATVEMDMCDADFDSFIYLYNSSQNIIASNDDGALCGGSVASYLQYTVMPGTYYIICEGLGSDTGDYTLEVYISNAAPVPDLDPLPTVTGECTATVTGPAPTATDECSGAVIGTTTSPLTYNSPGTYTVVWEYTDGEATSTQNQTVIVTDVTDPVPDLANLPDVIGVCSATISTTPTATDNCSGAITGTTTDHLTYNTDGTHVVTWSYDDGHGNVVTQTQNVILDDVTDPVPDVADLPDLTAECSLTAVAPTATDNCEGSITATTTDPLTYSTDGAYVITWTYDDGRGNVATQTQNVIIDDVTDPVPDVADLPDLTAECSLTAVAPTATDNCEGSITASTTDPLEYTTQGSYVITWSYDDGNGNVATQTQNVIIDDVTDPVPDVADLPDLTAECSLTAVVPTATDNCEGSITATTTDPLEYTTQGSYVITWSYDDGNGNVSTQTQNVIIDDVTDPVPDVADLPDLTAECSLTAVAPTATDNCEGALTASTTDPLEYTTQGSYVITWSYDDGNGNVSTQTQNVIIDDVTDPVIDVLDPVVASCSATLIAPVAFDNCSEEVIGTTIYPLTYDEQGIYTVIWEFDDGHGNVSMQSQAVIIDDEIAPVVDVVELPVVTGECSVEVVNVPTATDDCIGIVNASTEDPLVYSEQGEFDILWIYDDGHGNLTLQNQTVIVNDVTDPVPDVADLPDLTAECSLTAVALTATDNCEGSITATTTDPLEYTTQGSYVITWSYDDGNGNVSTQTQNVIIDDVTDPVPDVADLPDLTAECSLTAVAPTATDNCEGSITATTTDPLEYTTQGSYVITWSYDDGNGNVSTQTQNVIIDDVTDPVPDVADLPDLTAECSLTAVAPTATDNCEGSITATTTDPLEYTTQGSYVITWSYDDGNGNVATQTQNVIIDDVTDPVPDVADLPDLTAECSLTAVAPTATDNCEGALTASTTDPLEYTTQGSYVITWSYDDGNGNVATQTQNVIIDDVTDPVPDVADLPDLTAECSLTAVAPTATDNCEGSIAATTTDPLEYTTQGSYVITWSYDDGNGNVSTQTQNIMIDDVTDPVPDVADLPDLTAECSLTAVAPTATDNCEGALTASTTDPLEYTTQGSYVITWSYDDGNGNVSTQTQNVIIDDVTDPVPDVADLPDLTAECSLTAVAPTATDNCEGSITATTTDPLEYTTQGSYVITWSYDDGNGNVSTQTQNVIIDDVTDPVPDVADLPDLTAECSLTAVAPTATDNCEGSITATTTDPLEYTTQGSYVITWSYDDGNGNVSTQTQNVIIDDVTDPVPDVADLPDLTAECSLTAVAPTATDNCEGSIAATTTDPLEYTTQGSYVITWSYDDGNGNVSTQSQNVIIDDVTDPVPDVADLPDLTAECSLTAVAPTATDNCEGSITATTTDPLEYTTQGSYVITWSYDDGNGNVSTQTQNVIIDDVTDPVIDVLDPVVASCSATLIAPVAFDNCSEEVIGTTIYPLTYDEQGIYTVIWEFDDGHGNVSMQSQAVIIDDEIAPVVDVVELPVVTGECSVEVVNVPTATDDCIGIVNASTEDPLVYSEQGEFDILWIYDDGHGNLTLQNQTVIVNDVTAPVPDLSELPVLTGQCSVEVLDIPTATDNCSGEIVATTVDPLVYTAGDHVITWMFDDGNGNVITQTQEVVISDDVAPVVDVADLPIISGQCSVEVNVVPTATDNCNGTINGLTEDPLSYTEQGTYTILWSYDDGNGNITTQEQQVIVEDTEIPAINAPEDCEIMANEEHICIIDGCSLDPVAVSDNCGIVSCVNDYNGLSTLEGVEFPENTNLVITWTVTDIGGNVNSNSFTLNVKEFVGIDQNSLNDFSLYPNPTSDFVTIEFVRQTEGLVILRDAAGRAINEVEISDHTMRVDMSSLTPGMYMLEVRSKGNTSMKKIILR